MVRTEAAATLLPGLWQHRFVAAGGQRFHVVEAGEGPLIVLVHGFPQFWWTWRSIVPALASEGYRVAAVDLRGCAASDKPPDGYDFETLAGDIAGVIACLGARDAVVIGQGLGAGVAITLAYLHPQVVRALGVIGGAHPLDVLTRPRRTLTRLGRQRFRWLRTMRSPERALADRGLGVRILREWSVRPWVDIAPDVAAPYALALQVPFAADKALAPVRWLGRGRRHGDMRRYRHHTSGRLTLPVVQVTGAQDPLLRPGGAGMDAHVVPNSLTRIAIDACGHFPTEEAPAEVIEALVRWLAGPASAAS